METNPIIMDKKFVCDLCGEQETSQEGIRRSDDFVNLCADCLKRLQALPPSIRADVEERLIGNVI